MKIILAPRTESDLIDCQREAAMIAMEENADVAFEYNGEAQIYKWFDLLKQALGVDE